MKANDSVAIKALQKKILTNYKKNGRVLPWRQTTDPYEILISEIMLQQTQVDRVIPKYLAFLEAFPTTKDLAKAETKELLTLWQGLGYNNRALRLRELAKIVCEQNNCKIPTTADELLKLPGIGKYTSRSVLIFAHNQDIVTVDTNIRRILIHELKLNETVTENELYFYAEKLLPKGKSCDWHNALMDYGATLLTARKTGIKPTSKQSSFKGSDRYYRGQILKKLLEEPLQLSDVHKTYKLEKERAEKIVKSMEKDGVLAIKDNTLMLK